MWRIVPEVTDIQTKVAKVTASTIEEYLLSCNLKLNVYFRYTELFFLPLFFVWSKPIGLVRSNNG